MHEDANPKGILIPALIGGVVALLVGLLLWPDNLLLPHRGLIKAWVVTTYIVMWFAVGFIPAAGMAYLARQIFRSMTRR